MLKLGNAVVLVVLVDAFPVALALPVLPGMINVVTVVKKVDVPFYS